MAIAAAFSGPARIAIRAGRAFDGHQPMPAGALVLCAHGKIVGVEPAAAPVPDGWPVADYPDGTLLPGMTDCHVHLCGDSGTGALDRLPGYSEDELDLVIETALRTQLAAGVTTVRDLGDRQWAVLAWRDRVAAGTARFPAPAIVASGPPITTRRGHCWSMGGEADTAAELRAAVRERSDRGADIVKVMASGGNMTTGTDILACQYTPELLRAVVEEAHACGLPVTAHAHGLPAVIQAADAGADGIEHCSCLTERGLEQPAGLLEQLAANRTVVCPTMGIAAGVTPPPAVIAMQQRTGATWAGRQAMTGRLHQAGVTLVSGVDSGISAGKPHGILALAVGDLVTAGIPAAAALASATSTAAWACGLGDSKGRLRPGYDADIIVVAGDPLTDITALTQIQTVYLAGQAIPNASNLRSRGQAAEAGGGSRGSAIGRGRRGLPTTQARSAKAHIRDIPGQRRIAVSEFCLASSFWRRHLSAPCQGLNFALCQEVVTHDNRAVPGPAGQAPSARPRS